ncbi:MAG: AAA family ATPase [Alphaproteobacteria bacterium]|nr:AAA family ATPase [Alphaproteobacteria bacterium]
MGDVQDEVFALMARPQTFGPGIAAVERVDTHISALFLGGERVYKIKKAVRLPFLDFTTIERRREACEAELGLNRRTAPEMYRGLASVTREADGRLVVGGQGEPVEWMVVMNRFDQDTLFDRLADRGALTRELMRALADELAAFHRRARRRPDMGGRASLDWTIRTNDETFRAFIPEVFPAAAVDALTATSRTALDKVAPLLEGRREDGMVRHCHGDLHLGNICLYEGRPTIFDAIEFSEAVACIDVLYDLAFLLMDLEFRDHRRLASHAFNRYLEQTGDIGGMAAMPLFLSCRAAIRAHVSAAMAANQHGEAKERRLRDARRYLATATGCLAPPPARLVAVGGLSGSGKSRMGRELAPFLGAAPGAVVVRSDVLRKRLMGVDPETHLEADGYTPEMTERTYAALFDEAARVLAAGHSVVADAVFAKPEQRDRIAEVARLAGAPFQGVWLEAAPEVMEQRIVSRKRNASDATTSVLRQQLEYDLGEIGWSRVDTGRPKAESLRVARQVLGI